MIEGGAERTGLYFTLINAYLAPDEVAYIVDNSRSRLLFSSAARQPVAAAAAARATGSSAGSCPGCTTGAQPTGGATCRRWEAFDAVWPGSRPMPVPDESLGAAMLYSSGTTGQPKGILRALPTIAPSEPLPLMDFVRAMFGFREGMTYLNPAPLYHSAPQASVSASLRLGATTVVHGALRRRAVAGHWSSGTGSPTARWCRPCSAGCCGCPPRYGTRYDVSSLECIVHAAAPCPVPVKQAMIEWFGPIIIEYYGATEANGFTFCDSAEWLAHPGTVGRTILGELLILDDDGKQCPTGTDGTVWFRGATNFEYFDDPVKTAEIRTRRRRDQHRRRRRPRRRRRLPLPDRPQELHDHLGRGEHLPAGDREPARPPTRPCSTPP